MNDKMNPFAPWLGESDDAPAKAEEQVPPEDTKDAPKGPAFKTPFQRITEAMQSHPVAKK